METIRRRVTIGTSTPALILEVDINRLHSFIIRANGAMCIGDHGVDTTSFALASSETYSRTWQDFRPGENGKTELYGIAAVGTTCDLIMDVR